MRRLDLLTEEEEGFLIGALIKYNSCLENNNNILAIEFCNELIDKIENSEGVGLIEYEK